ncbi:MAG: capsular polysaccharide biosynthesis protein CapF, partial [Lachnospiraceae bacterium]|nr:capsular polysaccharide biosynthesis protein CapF [Lachnospiraceae bacterium]
QSFYESRKTLIMPELSDALTKKLYSTYLSYLPEDAFSYPLSMHEDERGSFTEFIKSPLGQVSINVVKPGIIKGNHWHHTKNEKFLVVQGKGCFQFRKYGEERVIEYHVTGEKPEVIDVPCGYVHNIINEGSEEMVVVIWANEIYNPDRPDTYYEKVQGSIK